MLKPSFPNPFNAVFKVLYNKDLYIENFPMAGDVEQ